MKSSQPLALAVTLVLGGALLTGCGGATDRAPAVTHTVTAGGEDQAQSAAPTTGAPSAEPSTSAPSPSTRSAAPSSSASRTPKTSARIRWVQVDRNGLDGHMEKERLTVPTVEGVPSKVQDAFDTKVSDGVGEMRDAFLDIQGKDEDDEPTKGSYLKTTEYDSFVYDGRYASAIFDLEGTEGDGGGHLTETAASATVDVRSGSIVPVSNFVDVSPRELRQLQREKLKNILHEQDDDEDRMHVLDTDIKPAWMVSDKGITFRYRARFETGFEHTFTIPWSDLRN